MKKLATLFFLLAALLFASPSFGEMYCTTTHSTVEIAASGTSTLPSAGINIRGLANAGYFGVQVILTGNGTGKLEYLESYNNSDFVTPSNASNIITAFTATSGNGSDGKDIVTFEPELAPFIKLKWTETGGANTITVTTLFCTE